MYTQFVPHGGSATPGLGTWAGPLSAHYAGPFVPEVGQRTEKGSSIRRGR
jgi:hypothetical protein